MQTQPLEQPKEKNRLVEDVWDAILNDKWMWIVTWGKPRCLPSDTQIHTSNGLDTMHDVMKAKAPLVLSDYHGNMQYMPATPFCSGKKTFFEVRTEHGTFLADAEQQFFTMFGWKQVRNLKAGNKIVYRDNPQTSASNYKSSTVISISEACEDWAYDLTVPYSHNFFIDHGFLTHNCGKTTLKMKLAFEVYKDWDKVLRSFIFNLAGLLYKLDSGEPERIYTRNMLHNRIPLLIYDDFGAHSNKAATQYDTSWDMFKGGFDVLATKVSVLIASMVDPTEPTFQIAQKYTHELYVFEGQNEERVYKYDEVNWQQDFKGWKARKRKSWIETNTFSEVPLDVYKQYDEMRMSLVDEVQQRIKDAMGDSLMAGILKRINSEDVGLLKILKEKGSVTREHLRDHLFEDTEHKYKESLIRCKARSLIVPIRHEGVTTYRYDITDLGLQVLDAVAKQGQDSSQKT